MNWVNIRTEILRAPAYVASEPLARATWFNVLIYCCEQENGGRIIDAADWKCRQWQQTCGVTLEEVQNAGRLLKWDGKDILVWNYPREKEAEIQKLRALSACGVAAKRKKAAAAVAAFDAVQDAVPDDAPPELPLETQPQGQPDGQPRGCQQGSTERKGMEVEGNGMEVPPSGVKGEKKTKVADPSLLLPTTENAQRVAVLFRRKLSTPWSPKEVKAYKAAGAITPEELTLLEEYYAAQRAMGNEGIHRRDLPTFLNNFRGEVDRAVEWKEQQTNPKPTHARSQRPTPQNPRVSETLNRTGRYAGAGMVAGQRTEAPPGVPASGSGAGGHAPGNGAIPG